MMPSQILFSRHGTATPPPSRSKQAGATILGTIAVLVFGLGALPTAALAVWPHDPNVSLPVCSASGEQQYPRIVSDDAGGGIIAWADQRSGNWDIFAQRVHASGSVQWTADGDSICVLSQDQGSPRLASDGAGGAIIVWEDNRSGNYDIYAQRVNASGVRMWAANGRALCTAALGQRYPQVAADGFGGVIIVWQDNRTAVDWDVYAQRVNASGNVLWTANGVAICTAVRDQQALQLISDGAGGAIVTWADYRSTTNWDIYARRVSAAGVPQWTANGVALCTAADDQTDPQIVSDGAVGAVVTWSDERSDYNISAQRVLANGVLDSHWPSNGGRVSRSGILPSLASDGAGGAIVIYLDGGVYAQHMLSCGVIDPAWPSDGCPLSTGIGVYLYPQTIPDGTGGAITTWWGARAGPTKPNIYAHHVLSSGVADPAWLANGRGVYTGGGDQQYPTITSDGASGAIVTCFGPRSGSDSDISAQRIERFGQLGNPEPVIASVRDVPHDQGGRAKLSWDASYLDAGGDPNLTAYDILRSVPTVVAKSALAAETREAMSLAGGRWNEANRYVVTQAAGATWYWEYLTSVDALHYVSGYSYLASTAYDSTGAGNPMTTFMVVGRNANRSTYWTSAPDSGYSVDNLPPGTPVFLASRHAADATRVRWRRNAEPDLAQYRLCRGTSAGFVPGAGNLVTAQADTGYVDSGASPFSWYKLAAVDSHGNESAVATLSPQQITGLPDGGVPAVTVLAWAVPNPFNPATTIGFSLSQPDRVRIAVFDAVGRRVRTLVDDDRPAGRYEVRWDGTTDGGRTLAAGVYFCRMCAETFSETRRMTLVK
jgi:hypothetical protein